MGQMRFNRINQKNMIDDEPSLKLYIIQVPVLASLGYKDSSKVIWEIIEMIIQFHSDKLEIFRLQLPLPLFLSY